jgi:hypothetical protein
MAGQLVPDKDPIKTYDARWEVTDHNPAEILRLCAGRQRQGFRRFTRTPWAFPRTSMPSIIVGNSECLPTLAERASFSQVVRGIFGIRAASRRGHQGCSPGETRGPIAPLGPAIPSDSDSLPIAFARDLVETTHRRPPG